MILDIHTKNKNLDIQYRVMKNLVNSKTLYSDLSSVEEVRNIEIRLNCSKAINLNSNNDCYYLLLGKYDSIKSFRSSEVINLDYNMRMHIEGNCAHIWRIQRKLQLQEYLAMLDELEDGFEVNVDRRTSTERSENPLLKLNSIFANMITFGAFERSSAKFWKEFYCYKWGILVFLSKYFLNFIGIEDNRIKKPKYKI